MELYVQKSIRNLTVNRHRNYLMYQCVNSFHCSCVRNSLFCNEHLIQLSTIHYRDSDFEFEIIGYKGRVSNLWVLMNTKICQLPLLCNFSLPHKRKLTKLPSLKVTKALSILFKSSIKVDMFTLWKNKSKKKVWKYLSKYIFLTKHKTHGRDVGGSLGALDPPF